MSDALYQVLISEEQRQISWYCSSCQIGAKAIMTQLLVMHERQNQFDHKLSEMENKHDTLNIRVSEVEDAVAKVADLQAQATNKSLATNQIPPILNKEVVATVYTQVNDGINRRQNIVVYNVPEGTSTLKADNVTHDRELMKQLTEHTTDGQYQPESLQVRRLGSRANTETGTDEARTRPLFVTFPGEDKKASVMKNLHKLKNKGEPFSEMVIKHDMSREDREKERLLQKEAREKTQQEQTSNLVYIVRGRPGERKIIKVKKKERNEQPNSGTSVGEIIVWYSNADVLTKDKLTELKCRINNNSTPPHIIAISEVKPKHFKRKLTLQEYNLEGYSMETINMNENKGRGMILFIHNSLPFQAHHFEVDFNEALFCTLKLKGKETLLVDSFYRSPNSTTENNDNLNELLEKLSENFFFTRPLENIDWKIMCTSVPSIEDKEFKFIEKLRDCYLIQHITEPTRGRGTTEPSLLDQ